MFWCNLGENPKVRKWALNRIVPIDDYVGTKALKWHTIAEQKSEISQKYLHLYDEEH